LLPNVNRWRQQVQLGELTQEELAKAIVPFPVASGEGQYVELIAPEGKGRQAILGVVAVRGPQAWFFKLMGDADLALQEKGRFEAFVKSVKFKEPAAGAARSDPHGGAVPTMPPTASGPSPLKFDKPDSWGQGDVRGMRKAAFRVSEGDKSVEITATDLSAAAGALLPNVNIWRQQIQLKETTQDELAKTAKTIQVAGIEGRYVELIGPEDSKRRLATLAVVILHQDKAWFFKLMGDAELALKEKERFEGFVKSVKFTAGNGGKNDK
jgi:hypothetical protein